MAAALTTMLRLRKLHCNKGFSRLQNVYIYRNQVQETLYLSKVDIKLTNSPTHLHEIWAVLNDLE